MPNDSKDLIIPDIVIDGVPSSQERMDPAVMQFLMQASATANLVKLRKLEESKVPVRTVELRRIIGPITSRIYLNAPWISFSLINDGAGALTVWVNDENDPMVNGMILNGGNYNCDFKYAVIEVIYMRAAPGTTAAVRIYGKEGRRI